MFLFRSITTALNVSLLLTFVVFATCLNGAEMHSPIMCIGNDIPAVVCRWEEQTSKDIMWRDIGLGEWLFNLDEASEIPGIVPAVLALAKDPAAAKAKAMKAMAFVLQHQRETMQMLSKSLLNSQEKLPTSDASTPPPPSWDQIRRVPMSGGLRAFWNVAGGDNATNYREAAAHGFEMVDLLSTYSDYPGKQKENIRKTLDTNTTNPWQKPEFFERIVKRNIEQRGNQGAIFVHDIEFSFEDDINKVWADPVVRAASKAMTREQFADAYLREWATWFTLPCQWAKERFPGTHIGIYGPQPFRRDYWGIAGKSAQQIDGTHHSDAELWQHIDPFVDYYIASIYVFYDKPDSLYYMAANVEENIERTRRFGNKPLYAYEWLRYHSSNKKLADQEVAPWLAEAMAVVPYFCGARGVALWGSEPKRQGNYYHTLPVFMTSLGRVSDFSAKIAAAKLMPDEPAHILWKAKRPLVRRMRVSADEWIILAVNPWQSEDATSTVEVPLEKGSISVELRGRHTEIFHCERGSVKRL